MDHVVVLLQGKLALLAKERAGLTEQLQAAEERVARHYTSRSSTNWTPRGVGTCRHVGVGISCLDVD